MDKTINKRILLGVCGGIAAYKSAELVRLLRKQDCEVRVVMTTSAMQFVTPLTFQALSGNSVATQLLNPEEENAMGHINLARWADMIIIAPATANTIAKLSYGLADDLLSTLCLAATCPIYIAPAMNQAMWNKPVTQENIQRIAAQNITVIGPEPGSQACGETGYGRMTEAKDICQALLQTNTHSGPLQSINILISAGPTREPLDPVRYITNRSSGKMGYALAEAAKNAGANTTLVSGPVILPTPNDIHCIKVETAEEMHHAVISRVSDYDIYIGAAAVADYSPTNKSASKIKKQQNDSVINLTKTKDILADVAALQNKPAFVVGFAAETDNLEHYAKDKLKRKGLDMIAANLVGQKQGGFDSDDNALHVYWPSGSKALAMTNKKLLAEQLMTLIVEKMNEKDPT